MTLRLQNAAFLLIAAAVVWPMEIVDAQSFSQQQRNSPGTNYAQETISEAQKRDYDLQAEEELRKGTALTGKGEFSDAISHLLAARGKVTNEYAASFDLALCYVGTRQYKQAIEVLKDLGHDSKHRADVENLLAQAYAGNGQQDEALTALETAAAITPQSEKLYLFVADACSDSQDYALALKVVAVGLRNLPDSARLHYERGIVLSRLDEFDRAKPDFDFVGKAAAGTEIGYIADVQKDLFEGDTSGAASRAREGIQKGFRSPILLTLLGEALLRSGVTPGQAEFQEAQAVLEQAVAERPNDPSSQIALGRLYLSAGRLEEAITHLEKAKQTQPDRPVIYANLAKAYRRHGNEQAAQQALSTLEKLNLARAEQIRSAPGERKMSYGGGETEETPPKQ